MLEYEVSNEIFGAFFKVFNTLPKTILVYVYMVHI